VFIVDAWSEGKMNKQEVIDLFFRDKANRYAKSSNIQLRLSIKEFFAFTNSELVDINKRTILSWIKYLLSERNLKPISINLKLWGIRAFFSYCVEESILEVNPVLQIKPLKVKQGLPRPIDHEILFAMKDASISNIKYRAILETLECTGVRVSELVGIDVEDIKWDQRIILIRIAKGGFQRFVPFTAKCGELIHEYLAIRPNNIDTALFLNQTKTRYHPIGIQYIINKYRVMVAPLSHVTPHMYRHTFATKLLEKEATTQVIAKLMGIKDIKNVEIYAKSSSILRKKNYEKYKK
jgi:site-specific recombinase XerD